MSKNRRAVASTVLASAIGLVACAGTPAVAQAGMSPQMQQKLHKMLEMHPGASKKTIMSNMQRVMKYHLVKCYGVNAIGKNDCASGSHSCAGQATKARDADSFVLIPNGDCQKIDGGSLTGPA